MSYTPQMVAILKALAQKTLTLQQIISKAFTNWPQADAMRNAVQALQKLIQIGDVLGPDKQDKYYLSEIAMAQIEATILIKHQLLVNPIIKIINQWQNQPICQKITISGDMRREEKKIQAIDLVVLLNSKEHLKQFQQTSQKQAKYTIRKTTTKLQTIYSLGVAYRAINYHICYTPSNWYYQLFLTTGCNNFVQRAKNYWTKKTKGGTFKQDGIYTPDGQQIKLTSENHIFQLLQSPIVPPVKRTPK